MARENANDMIEEIDHLDLEVSAEELFVDVEDRIGNLERQLASCRTSLIATLDPRQPYLDTGKPIREVIPILKSSLQHLREYREVLKTQIEEKETEMPETEGEENGNTTA